MTEFPGDALFDVIAKHWPERGDGWQYRIQDLAAEMRELGPQGLGIGYFDDECEVWM